MTVPEVYVTSWHIPASVIAKWPRPNLVNPERRFGVIPVLMVLLILSTSFVFARIYARLSGKAGRLGIDDILILVSWFFGVITVIGTTWIILAAGLDRHIWDAILAGSKGGLAAWLLEFAFHIELNVTKLSVLVFYRRLFFTMEPRKRLLLIDIPIVALITFAVSTIIILINDCHPTSAYWESLNPNYTGKYTCIDRRILDPAKSSVNVLSDVYALLLPQFLIWRLNLKVLSRFRLAFIFGCGWIATGAGIARTYWISRLHTDPLRDLTWVGYEVQIWAHLESQLAIVCASIPVAIVFTTNHKRKSSEMSSLEDGTYPSLKTLEPESQPERPQMRHKRMGKAATEWFTAFRSKLPRQSSNEALMNT